MVLNSSDDFILASRLDRGLLVVKHVRKLKFPGSTLDHPGEFRSHGAKHSPPGRGPSGGHHGQVAR